MSENTIYDFEFIEELEMGLTPSEFREYKSKEVRELSFDIPLSEDTMNKAVDSMAEEYYKEYQRYHLLCS